MFDFVDNQVLRIILELVVWLIGLVIGFFSGIKYSNKKNKVGNISNSNIGILNQGNK